MNKDLILKRGDRVTYTLDSDIEDTHILYVDGYDGESIKSFEKDNSKVLKVERQVKYETIYEYKEILDKEEKEYLKNVIKPFRNKVEFIRKMRYYSNAHRYYKDYIQISLPEELVEMPSFEQNAMYKGMEVERKYTLEELGL